MGYGHAERNLAAIRVLTADTITLLRAKPALTVAERDWLATASMTATYEREPRQHQRAAGG